MKFNTFFHCFALIATSGTAVARPALGDIGSIPMSSLFSRATDDDFYFDDLSSIKKIAAIGDSYSAGIGAGDRLQGPGGEYLLCLGMTNDAND